MAGKMKKQRGINSSEVLELIKSKELDYISGDLSYRKSKFIVKCKVDNNIFCTSYSRLLVNNCKKCWFRTNADRQRFSQQDMLDLIDRKNFIYISGTYNTAKSIFLIKCKLSDHILETYYDKLRVMKHGCNKCFLALKKQQVFNIAQKIANDKGGMCHSIFIRGGRQDYMANVECKLSHRWAVRLNALKNDVWCRQCFYINSRNYTWLNLIDKCYTIDIMFENCPENTEESLYNGINKNKQWWFKCFCGQIFYPILYNILGDKISSCGCTNSFEQRELHSYIEKLEYKTRYNDRIAIAPYEIDIYLPDLNKGIEYDGEFYHHSDWSIAHGSLDRMHMKDLICIEKGIQLLRVRESNWLKDKEFEFQKIIDFIDGRI